MATYTEARTSNVTVGAWVSRLVSNLVEEIRVQRDIRRTYRELSALSPRELDDLGLSPLDIARVSRECARV